MKSSTLTHHRARMGKVVKYLSEHRDDVIDPSALAKVAGLSPRQLERVFLRTIGESPRAHLRRLRIERAAVRLRTSKSTILTIALEAGFESHEAFTRVFRLRFGQSPAAFRRLATVPIQPRARAQLWQLIVAGGLRRYVEEKSSSAASSRSLSA